MVPYLGKGSLHFILVCVTEPLNPDKARDEKRRCDPGSPDWREEATSPGRQGPPKTERGTEPFRLNKVLPTP